MVQRASEIFRLLMSLTSVLTAECLLEDGLHVVL